MPPGTPYFYVAYRVAVGNCVWEKINPLSQSLTALPALPKGEPTHLLDSAAADRGLLERVEKIYWYNRGYPL